MAELIVGGCRINRTPGIFFNADTLQIFIDRDDASAVSLTEVSIPHICRSHETPKASENTGRAGLSRLTLNISNACNLACSYCYAAGGDYGVDRKVMKSDDAIELLSLAFDVFDIDCLMFFGGEPSLNVKAITDCCIFVKELHQRGLIKKLPKFGVISNLAGFGTNFDLFLAVCKTFELAVTVSIDGPENIHDANRRTRKGKGSFGHVKRNYLRAKKIGIPLQIQCTYTNRHVESGISVIDLMKFFKLEFDEIRTHIAPASCSSRSREHAAVKELAIVESYCEAIKYMVATLGTPEYLSIDIGERLINALLYREHILHYCPAGASELTIGPDGELYPCFMFIGHDLFNMGRIEKGTRWLSPQGESILDMLKNNSKSYHEGCRKCWARNVCFGCLGADYLETESVSLKPQCGFIMSIVAETIVRLAEVSQGLPVGIYGNEQRHSYLRMQGLS